jgi:Na+/H+-dicarboxylate symporter
MNLELYFGIGMVIGIAVAVDSWFKEKKPNRSLLITLFIFQIAMIVWPLAIIGLIMGIYKKK